MCRKVTSFANSEWDGLLDRLLEAFEHEDTEEISSCCNAGHFKALDPEVCVCASYVWLITTCITPISDFDRASLPSWHGTFKAERAL